MGSCSSVLRLHGVDDGGRVLAGEQPLSKIAIHKTVLALRDSVFINASPLLLGLRVISFPAAQTSINLSVRFCSTFRSFYIVFK